MLTSSKNEVVSCTSCGHNITANATLQTVSFSEAAGKVNITLLLKTR